MKKLIYISCCLFLLSCQEASKEVIAPETVQINKIVLKQKKVFDIPGIAVGMIKDGDIIYTDAHGVKGLNTGDSLTTQSLFHMASVSKPFVATAIVQLMEKGKIDLDEKLTHYLPYFVMDDERYKDITIKHMLNHTSGIPDVDDYEWDNPQYDDGAAERYARSQQTIKLDFAPGAQYNYSNAAFDILCDVISKVSGMTFEDYTKENIFEPVGMKNSTFFKPDVPQELATKPHLIDDSLNVVVSKIYPYNRRHAGSSTLHSNVEDMLLWAEVNLNKGMINGKRIYEESSYKLLTTSQTKLNETRSVGLSWFLDSINNHQMIFHQGGDVGYSTFFAFIPAKKSAIAMMVNADYFWSDYASETILKNLIFNDSIIPQGPIYLKLKDYILKDGIAKTKEVYFKEKQKSNQDYMFWGNLIDQLGYWLIDRNHLEKAVEVLKFNVELEPEDTDWPDSVADAYTKMDSIDLAIQWYEKALDMNPNQDYTKEKLNKLLKNR